MTHDITCRALVCYIRAVQTAHPEAASSVSAPAALSMLHVDATLLVVDKPAGLLSVPGRLAEHRDCVISRLQQHYPDALTVHRLDQVTSGAMVFARGTRMQALLSALFASRQVDKRYEAWVEGVVEADSGQIELPLICDWPNRPRQMVDHAAGKPSLTEWNVLVRDTDQRCTRLALQPRTGRSHQLRVHLASIGHPIAGDVLYGARPAPRVYLHATSLGFTHPDSGEYLALVSSADF